jgi:exo-beta-1,3-glucanase (GH17 family)
MDKCFRITLVAVAVVTLSGQAPQPQSLLVEDAGFVPSGWMGDGAMKVDKPESGVLQVNMLSTDNPHSPPYSQQWTYRPRLGHMGWAAVAWQFPENNWGEKPGKDWSNRGFSRVTVWARGLKDSHGVFPKLQFKAGGNTNPDRKNYPYRASFEVESDFVTLTDVWKQYSLDLKGKNLTQVISAFTVVVRAQDFPREGGTFFLDDIEYSQDSAPRANVQPSTQRDQAAKLPRAIWVAYAPTHYYPSGNPPMFPSDESIRADLAILHAAGFSGLVTYGADLPTIPRIAQNVGFTAVLLGIWNPADATEMRLAEDAARSPIVAGFIVGNEGLGFHRYAPAVLRDAMDRIRTESGKPVSTTEVAESYFAKPELGQWSDFLAVNAHPYFHEIRDPIKAAEWTAGVYASLRESYPDKEILLKEVGLPTAAPGLSEKSQYDYYRALKRTGVEFVYFEAFDAMFKEGTIERSWGIFHADRSPKPAASLVTATDNMAARNRARP